MSHADTLRAVVPPGGIAQMLDQNPQPTPRLQAAIGRRKDHRMTNNIDHYMSYADHLRGMAKAFMMVGSHERVDPCLAGADALDALERVRAVLTDLRFHEEAALQRWDDTGDTWDGAVSDTLHDTIYLLTEALEGDTK